MYSLANDAPGVIATPCPVHAEAKRVHRNRSSHRSTAPASQRIITSKDVNRLKGEVASPAELKKQVDDIKHDYDKRLQSVELSQKILQWLACALIILILGTMLRTGWFDRAAELANRSGAVVQANQPPGAGAPAAPTPVIVPDHLGCYILGAGGIAGLCSILTAFIVRKRQK